MVVSVYLEERRCLFFNFDIDYGINMIYKVKLFVCYGLKGKFDVSVKFLMMSLDVIVVIFWWLNCNKRRNFLIRILSFWKMCDG